MNKVGIICLANGPYSIFIDNLIETCEKYFLKNFTKKYFIITDKDFPSETKNNVTKIKKPRYGWPKDCLVRPQYSVELKDKFNDLDYVYFFNANMSIYSEVGEEALPDKSGLIGVEHSCFTHRNISQFTYERNPQSKAYISLTEGEIYYQACFWGGKIEEFNLLSETISNWMEKDISNGIEAIWLDESYLNKYFLLNKPKVLSYYYAFPTHFPLYDNSPEVKILQLQKNDYIKTDNFKYI